VTWSQAEHAIEPEAGRGLSRLASLSWALLALVIGLVITIAANQIDREKNESEYRRNFEESARRITRSIEQQLDGCETILRSLQAIFLASGDVDADDFDRAYETLNSGGLSPSLKAVAFTERVRMPDGDHFITRFARPLPENEAIIGLDVNTQPANLKTVWDSLKDDQIRMSPAFKLRQTELEGKSNQGVVMRLPAFSHGPRPKSEEERLPRFVGSIAVSFVVQALIEGAVKSDGDHPVKIRVTDVSGGSERSTLYDDIRANGSNLEQDISGTLSYGGRLWRIDYHNADPPPSEGLGSLTFWGGVLSSILFACLAWSVASTRSRALALGKSMSARYRDSEERFRRLNELLPTLVLLVDRQSGDITYANHAARTQLGIRGGAVPASSILPASIIDLLTSAGDNQNLLGEALLTASNGTEFWANVIATSAEFDGRLMWLLVASDVSEQRELTERLGYAASHDALTRLPNRQEFELRLRETLATCQEWPRVLMFVDLDQFKLINDTSGHMAGDQLLMQLAMVMRDQMGEHDVLARLGGDEFGVLLCHDVSDAGAAMARAETLRRAIDGYVFMWEQRSYTISASIGAALIEGSDISMQELMARVDTACYMAKENGRNRVHFYSEDDDASTQRRSEMEWANRLRWAIDENRLMLAYQELHPLNPALHKGGPHIEVLLRLADEPGKLVTPGAFLPAAERFGLMPRIDRWVIETTLANLDRVHPSGTGLEMCAINLSGASLEDDTIVDFIVDALDRHEVDPRRLLFEITETVAVRNLGRVSELIGQLRALGCKIALDDFGAGMSSFGYLKNLGIDKIKIDGAFVFEIERDSISHSIVRAITEIGHQHGLVVVAEWVSSQTQAEALAAVGVDYAQGFGLHRPEIAVFMR